MRQAQVTRTQKTSPGRWFLYFFDSITWTLLIAPLLTGGLWIKRPGLWIELSELAIPTLIVAILAFILNWKFKTSIRESSSFRFGLFLWNHWKLWIESYPKRSLLIGALGVGALWFLVAYRRHETFQSHASDLGIFTSAIWNLTHGYGYVSSLKDGMNLFGDHQSPLFWLAYPFFKLFPNPVILLALQSFGLALGAIPLYFLSRRILNHDELRTYAQALPLIYWCSSPIRNANRFDFHPEVLFLPLALGAVWGLQSSKTRDRWVGLALFILALSAKESCAIVLAALSAAWICGFGEAGTRGFTRRAGAFLLVLSLGVGYLDMKLVPALLKLDYAYQGAYHYLGETSWQIILSPLLNPWGFWGKIFSRSSIKFISWILAPLLFLPLLNWRTLFILAPACLMYILSLGDLRMQTIYHYGIEATFAAFIGFPEGFLHFTSYLKQNKFKFDWKKQLPVLWLMVILLSFGRSEFFFIRKFENTDHTRWLKTQLVPCIRPEVPLSASGALVPHLVQRSWIHHLPHLEITGQWVGQEKVSCVLFDPEVNNWPLGNEKWQPFLDDLPKNGYQLVFDCHQTKLYEWTHAPTGCLQCLPECKK